MTAQQLLDELLALQKQGFDLDSLNVRATELAVLYDYVESSFCVKSVEVDDSDLILYND